MNPISFNEQPSTNLSYGSGLRSIYQLRFVAMIVVGLMISAEAMDKAWAGYRSYRDQVELQRLNGLVQLYAETSGNVPDPNLIELYHRRLTKSRLIPTPYGGYYRYDPLAGIVYNPHR